jgi:hypothetical protein
MAWFKVDDGFYTSHKVLQIPRENRHEAIGAWILVGAWSANKMTDGFIPNYVLDEFGVSKTSIDRLVAAGLWDVADGGIVFHDWCDYQPTREQLEAKKSEISSKRSEAGSKGANQRWQKMANAWQTDSKTMAKDSPEPEPEPEPDKSANEIRADVDSLCELLQTRIEQNG